MHGQQNIIKYSSYDQNVWCDFKLEHLSTKRLVLDILYTRPSMKQGGENLTASKLQVHKYWKTYYPINFVLQLPYYAILAQTQHVTCPPLPLPPQKTHSVMHNLTFSQWSWWRLKSSRMSKTSSLFTVHTVVPNDFNLHSTVFNLV